LTEAVSRDIAALTESHFPNVAKNFDAELEELLIPLVNPIQIEVPELPSAVPMNTAEGVTVATQLDELPMVSANVSVGHDPSPTTGIPSDDVTSPVVLPPTFDLPRVVRVNHDIFVDVDPPVEMIARNSPSIDVSTVIPNGGNGANTPLPTSLRESAAAAAAQSDQVVAPEMPLVAVAATESGRDQAGDQAGDQEGGSSSEGHRPARPATVTGKLDPGPGGEVAEAGDAIPSNREAAMPAEFRSATDSSTTLGPTNDANTARSSTFTAHAESTATGQVNSMARATSQGIAESTRTEHQITDHMLSARQSIKDGKASLELTLDPPELGRITIELTERENQLTARLLVAEAATLDSIRRLLPTMMDALTEAGLSLDDLQLSSYQHQDSSSGGDAEASRIPASNHARSSHSEEDLPASVDMALSDRVNILA
jgi:hypothetical protein